MLWCWLILSVTSTSCSCSAPPRFSVVTLRCRANVYQWLSSMLAAVRRLCASNNNSPITLVCDAWLTELRVALVWIQSLVCIKHLQTLHLMTLPSILQFSVDLTAISRRRIAAQRLQMWHRALPSVVVFSSTRTTTSTLQMVARRRATPFSTTSSDCTTTRWSSGTWTLEQWGRRVAAGGNGRECTPTDQRTTTTTTARPSLELSWRRNEEHVESTVSDELFT